MEYIIVKVSWPDDVSILAKKVQEKIEEGFEPIGGIATWDDKLYHRCFTQTMTKLRIIDDMPEEEEEYDLGMGW